MADQTIVLTGATGFVGFSILQAALKEGYNVRVVVRSESKAESLRSNPVLASLNRSSQYTFHVVPDLSAPNALDESSAGAHYMIHSASPLPFALPNPESQWDEIVLPAINNTISALESASRSGTIRRVVITSSCAAYITPEILTGPVTSPVYITEDNKNGEIPPPYSNVLVSYVASKTAALLRSERWLVDHKPAFDIVNIAPTYVMGRHELATSTADLLATSNVLFLRMALGAQPGPDNEPEVASVTHVSDVVKLHLLSLDETRIPANDYLVGEQVQWNDVKGFVQRLFPDEVAKGVLPNNSDVPTKPVCFAGTRTVETFGFELKGVESMVRDTVGQYLELLDEEKTSKL